MAAEFSDSEWSEIVLAVASTETGRKHWPFIGICLNTMRHGRIPETAIDWCMEDLEGAVSGAASLDEAMALADASAQNWIREVASGA